ncbi:hypothetical protein SAMN06265784_108213 [Paraburkholderia susongensis]|uniref:Uncharacterized protein n=1 Tax=Paraburkholderia susongensis TaxID=1515439 RepID=A0A1X7LRI7_9BURK|nr:hypothetical protein SAMN06265784_108213 [Paraburkholderia susongensis]
MKLENLVYEGIFENYSPTQGLCQECGHGY